MWIDPVTLGGGMTMQKALPGGVAIGAEKSLLHPGLGPARLDLLGVVGFGEILRFGRFECFRYLRRMVRHKRRLFDKPLTIRAARRWVK